MTDENRILFVTPAGWIIGATDDGSVGMEPNWPADEIGLAPGLRLVLRMTPDEAREIARRLHSKADEVEAAQRSS